MFSFVENDYYYGKLPQQEMPLLLDLYQNKGVAALKAYLNTHKLRGRRVLLNSFRANHADGRFLLALDLTSVVLDLGCGFGTLAIPIAKVCKEVFAVDATFERVQFLAQRVECEDLANIIPIHASVWDLPFSKSSFDCIVMNGVLEWVGEWLADRSPREVQLKALERCRELLKPSGTLFVAIENRIGFEFLYRSRDPHSKLYFTSLLPRKLASVVTRLLKHKSYRTYTYTRRGYQRLFRQAGYSHLEFYCPWPRYQDPRYISRWGEVAAARYFRKTVLRAQRFDEYVFCSGLARLGLDWLFSPSFIILAQK